VTAEALDLERPNAARIYDVLLGGKDNFGLDRTSVKELLRAFPAAATEAVDNRRFILRAVRFLARAGVRQFLDIGVGLPRAPNVHEVLHEELSGGDERGRVLYVDVDALAAVHARALLTSTDRVATDVFEGDLYRCEDILASKELARTIDLSLPVGLLLGAVLPHCGDGSVPAVRRLIEALSSGSHVVVSHYTLDFLEPDDRDRAASFPSCLPWWPRSRSQLAGYLDGLDVIDPGWVGTAQWRPELNPMPHWNTGEQSPLSYAVVARLR
jgi:hypothetical protein